ncbi:MAG: glutamate--tRNA ligase [Candidatus Saccharimonadales bacterium]
MDNQVRTRFAPSPTGYLHVGGIRTALFAWLVAKQQNGKFILRLEDTDKNREVGGSAEHLIESLRTIGLNYDEGPDIGGEYGPYKQSERLKIYKTWGQRLIASGRAYADPYTPNEVQAFRDQAKSSGKPFLYRNNRPEKPPAWDGSTALRFKSDPKSYTWHDEVMGDLSTGPDVIDDFILIKSDGYPTYNFAHIVDDFEMKISHIIRGQEFLASIPNYLNLYEALDIEPPIMATMPHILAESGNRKLSKRDGAKDVLDYFREGFLVEALFSFIATLGWNDGTTQEYFTKDELITKFSLSRVQKSGARFDEQRLKWINGSLIRQMNIDTLFPQTNGFWPKASENFDDNYKKRVLSLIQERLKFFAEIPDLTTFFFEEPTINLELINKNKQLKKMSRDELRSLLKTSLASLEQIEFNAKSLTETLNNLLDMTDQKPAVLFGLIRISTTWVPSSPSLAESLEVLGKDTSLKRLQASLNSL